MAKAIPPRPAAPPARAGTRAQSNTLSPLRITYYRRMHRQRVYPVTIGWNSKDRPPAGAKPVKLRLLMAGTQIVPSEQILDPAKTDAVANFYVTPLARGNLYGERLEVLIDDRKVQEVPLSCKVTSQRMTLVLLALAFVIPALMLHYGKYSYLMPEGQDAQKRRGAAAREMEDIAHDTPGLLLQKRLQANLPETPDVIKENVPQVAKVLEEDIPGKIGDVYDLLWMHRDEPIPLYVGLGLLLLAVLCGFMRRAKRKRRIGPPIPLPAAGMSLTDDDEE